MSTRLARLLMSTTARLRLHKRETGTIPPPCSTYARSTKKADAKVAETIDGISDDMLQELGSKIGSCPKTVLSLCQLSY